MSRFFSMLMAAVFLAAVVSARSADEVQPAQELRELRQAVQMQSRHIEVLTEQVARLTRALEGQRGAEPAASAATPSPEATKSSAEPTPEAPKAELVVKAEPVANGTKHTVAKGETLTSIAKQYSIPVADLKNANKIENERKLQIGQVLTVPTNKNTETPDKKENP